MQAIIKKMIAKFRISLDFDFLCVCVSNILPGITSILITYNRNSPTSIIPLP